MSARDLVTSVEALALLTVAFLPLERLFPARRQPVLRPRIGTDLLFFLGQYLLWTSPVVAALVYVHRHVDALPLASVRAAVAALPIGVQLVLAILVSDVAIYWMHRASHHFELLWRFHRVHHTSEHLDWLAAHREHPLDNLATRLTENLPLIVLGVPLPALAGFAAFRGLWALFIHSNCALDPGPLRYLLGAPRLHHAHHAVEHGGRVNFANLSPLMDLAFGTYRDPRVFPARYGLGTPVEHAYVVQLLEPLVPARAAERARVTLRRGRAALIAKAPPRPEAEPARGDAPAR
ncbi:MAG: sterol desaturase family protein [Planctomycetes bacterium]|nr:sterol desaturase family protein [Planctomycetota bacterium]